MGEFSDQLKDIVIWDKGFGQPAMSPGVLNRQSELILIFENENAISRKFSKFNFERGTLSDIWNISRGKKIDKSHGAVFPEMLVYTILDNFSNEGDVIYDPFMGSGTTAVVSQKMKRKWVGSELSPNYCELIQKRIDELGKELF
jgi:site-specific DNA-methyltransferase (adenine-specific)/modification methylase